VGVEIVVEDTSVFTQDQVLEEIQGADGTASLLMVGLGSGCMFCASVAIVIPGQPEIVDAYPHGAKEFG
jgi:hypothetical protein